MGPSSSMARCTPEGVCARRKASALSYLCSPNKRRNAANLELADADLSPCRTRESSSLPATSPEPSPWKCSVPSNGAAKRGVTPSMAVGRKNGALASGFGASLGLFRSLTRSRCSVAIHFCGGTSDNVSSSGSSGDALAGSASFRPASPPSPLAAASPASLAAASSGLTSDANASWSSGAPGSSTRTSRDGSGRSKGAESEGSKRNLFAHTWMALPLE
mmetsp:Transcript_75026/g.229575  ORF Transcript_75026/g.229575 Transcript_75026/m.229575 type:complete len:218 (-) Transcript_75026:258-911(-)